MENENGIEDVAGLGGQHYNKHNVEIRRKKQMKNT